MIMASLSAMEALTAKYTLIVKVFGGWPKRRNHLCPEGLTQNIAAHAQPSPARVKLTDAPLVFIYQEGGREGKSNGLWAKVLSYLSTTISP